MSNFKERLGHSGRGGVVCHSTVTYVPIHYCIIEQSLEDNHSNMVLSIKTTFNIISWKRYVLPRTIPDFAMLVDRKSPP